MELLNFDIYAMVKPKNEQDILVLAKEALAELKVVNDALDNLLSPGTPSGPTLRNEK